MRVVISEQLYFTLDALLPSRSGGDRPTRNQFEHLELVSAHQIFVEHWDDGTALLADPYDPRTRVLVVAGHMVPMYAIRGRLLTDGETVELYDITIDFEGLPEPDDQ
jgi:hypothetical protein